MIEEAKGLQKGNESYSEISKARIHFYRKNQKEKKYFMPEIYFFVRTPSFKMKKQGLLTSKGQFECISKKEFVQRRQKFIRSVKQIESMLNSANLEPKSLDSKKWFELLFEYLNLDRVERIGTAHYREPQTVLDPSINEQLTLTDFIWDKKSISLGGYKFS